MTALVVVAGTLIVIVAWCLAPAPNKGPLKYDERDDIANTRPKQKDQA